MLAKYEKMGATRLKRLFDNDPLRVLDRLPAAILWVVREVKQRQLGTEDKS